MKAEQLEEIVTNLQKRMAMLEQTNQLLIQSNRQLIAWTDQMMQDMECYKRNVVFEVNDGFLDREGFWYPQIRSDEDAIEQIVMYKKSMARFGDGEFSVIAGRIRHKFQTELDDTLAERLKEVLEIEQPDLLVGIADNYGSLEKYNEQAKREIRYYLNPSVRKEHLQLIKKDRIYYDAYMTRPYAMYADNETDAPKKRFFNLKRIWEKRNCVFVEGAATALGVGNDLFDNAESIKRILVPAQNAFQKYPEILETCKKQDKENLFLLAAGPTATVLAYDLCRLGYQAVDIGHIDLEYEWFLQGKGHRTVIANKYNNEVEGGEYVTPVQPEYYHKQIIADLSV